MTRDEAHKLIDQLFDAQEPTAVVTMPEEPEEPAEERKLPEGKRVVRTKSQGDRVYLLDEIKKTRHWLTKPEILEAQGFTMADVGEVTDTELAAYAMAAPLHTV